jgi:hypothetical protein
MTRRKPVSRVLAITPSFIGFGYALIEEPIRLVDWGVKSVSKDRNTQSVAKVEELITLYAPQLLALPDDLDAKSRRSERVRQLIRNLGQLAERSGLKVHKSSQGEVREFFFNTRPADKHDVADFLAKAFPEELEAHLPPRRQPWTSEDYRMGIFAAVALAVAANAKEGKWKAEKLKVRIEKFG